MDIYEIIGILRYNFSKKQFFVRVYHINDEIIIYNDVKLVLKYKINLFDDIDKMIKKIIIDVKKEIENKYITSNNMVSVIIPNYNNDFFFKNVISRILDNTYNNIEIIVVDDKSTDNSINIIKEFESDKIRILENIENSGTYYSRNRGILMSKGEYILIVDGDDYIDSTYIENMVDNLKNSDDKYWGYGVHFERVYMDDDFNIIEKKKSISYNILFKRKLFNYLGFFQNSRFGADSEFIYRAEKYNYPIKFDNFNNNIQYHANSLKNKNLTRTINWNIRKEYIKNAKKDVNERNYIEMAYLD
jgi:glycosyltransferase involved in cell wall biosynthesis